MVNMFFKGKKTSQVGVSLKCHNRPAFDEKAGHLFDQAEQRLRVHGEAG
jgi:hypothetical protein